MVRAGYPMRLFRVFGCLGKAYQCTPEFGIYEAKIKVYIHVRSWKIMSNGAMKIAKLSGDKWQDAMLFLLRMLPIYIKDRNIEARKIFKAHFTTHREYYSVQFSS